MHAYEKFLNDCKRIAGAHAHLLEKPKSGIADLALPCFSFSQPVEEAKKLAERYSKKARGTMIGNVFATGPYVNFFIDEKKFSAAAIKEILKEKEKYGKGKKKGRIMVEYSAPNSNKPLHVGHLRNDSIGMAVSNILAFSGCKVIRANLVSDRGIHICKTMLAYKKWGGGTPEKKPDHFVGDFYVLFEKNKTKEMEEEAQKMLVDWEKNNKEVKALWKKMNSWVLSGFKETYEKFGSEFDVWFYESEFYDSAKPIISKGLKKGVFFKDNEGSVVAKLEPLPDKAVLRKDGTSIYITNDLSLTVNKFKKYKLDKSIWVVASEQNLYFQQLFRIFELLGYKWAKNCCHLSYGLVHLPSGRMKSREGTVIDADDLLNEVKNLAKKEIHKRGLLDGQKTEKRALSIALAAIKYFFLKVEPKSDMLFDPEKAISFEGNTGPYLQYTYARASSILKKAGKKKGKIKYEESMMALIKNLAQFPEEIERAAKDCKPNYIANYLYELATLFNEYYHKERVLGSKNEFARLQLVEAVRIVLGNGLKLLGIEPLEEM